MLLHIYVSKDTSCVGCLASDTKRLKSAWLRLAQKEKAAEKVVVAVKLASFQTTSQSPQFRKHRVLLATGNLLALDNSFSKTALSSAGCVVCVSRGA